MERRGREGRGEGSLKGKEGRDGKEMDPPLKFLNRHYKEHAELL